MMVMSIASWRTRYAGLSRTALISLSLGRHMRGGEHRYRARVSASTRLRRPMEAVDRSDA